MEKTQKLTKGCVVLMKASSGLQGYGNAQCVSNVCEPLGEISLYGHNQCYKTYDIQKIIEYPPDIKAAEAENEALKSIGAEYWQTLCHYDHDGISTPWPHGTGGNRQSSAIKQLKAAEDHAATMETCAKDAEEKLAKLETFVRDISETKGNGGDPGEECAFCMGELQDDARNLLEGKNQ
jgi:hypothetical protein